MLSVEYNETADTSAIIEFRLLTGFAMIETQLYIGNDILPTGANGKFTTSPGLYPYKHEGLGDGTTFDRYEIKGLEGDVYIVAHTVVCDVNVTTSSPTLAPTKVSCV